MCCSSEDKMKISELIGKLLSTMSLWGDLEVHVWPYDGQKYTAKLSEVTMTEGKCLIE